MPSHDRIPIEVLNHRPETAWRLLAKLAVQALLEGLPIELTDTAQLDEARS